MSPFAVVPVFTSVGVALLPTVLAAVTSVVALLLKPRALLALGRRSPRATLGTAGALAVLLTAAWWMGRDRAGRPPAGALVSSGARVNWSQVALNLIAQEQAGKKPTALVQPTPTEAPLVLGRDFSRCSHDGGPVPTGLRPLWSFRPEDTLFLSSPLGSGF